MLPMLCEYCSCTAIIRVSTPFASQPRICTNLILRLCSRATLDPMAFLRRVFRKLISNSDISTMEAVTEIEFDSSPTSTTKLAYLATACQSKSTQDDSFTEILACIALVAEYRITIRRLNREGMLSARDSERIANKIIEDHKVTYHLRIGDHALALCWAISPRNLFGLMVLSVMSLSRAELYNMKKGTRAALIMLFTGNWTPDAKQDLLPSPVCAAVNEMVRTIIPAAE